MAGKKGRSGRRRQIKEPKNRVTLSLNPRVIALLQHYSTRLGYSRDALVERMVFYHFQDNDFFLQEECRDAARTFEMRKQTLELMRQKQKVSHHANMIMGGEDIGNIRS